MDSLIDLEEEEEEMLRDKGKYWCREGAQEWKRQ